MCGWQIRGFNSVPLMVKPSKLKCKLALINNGISGKDSFCTPFPLWLQVFLWLWFGNSLLPHQSFYVFWKVVMKYFIQHLLLVSMGELAWISQPAITLEREQDMQHFLNKLLKLSLSLSLIQSGTGHFVKTKLARN